MMFVRSLLLLPMLLLSQCAPTKPAASLVPAPMSLPKGFCYLDTIAPKVKTDLVYSHSNNFTGRPVAGYEGKRAILREDAAHAVKRAADILAKRGYGLKVMDAYRPHRAMHDFKVWSRSADDSTRERFYPRITKQGIYDGRYIGSVSEHSWGIAVDVTLIDLATGQDMDMGTIHDFLDPRSATSYDGNEISATAKKNRRILVQAMREAGMANYSKEWWHFWLKNAPEPYYRNNFLILDDYLPSVSTQ